MRRVIASRGLQFGTIAVAALALPMLLFPDIWKKTLSTSGFLPHSYCFAWDPGVIWLNAGSDVIIGLSYFAISGTLAVMVHRARREIPFSWMLLAFGLFIVACGITHLMEVWTLWEPRYWLTGNLKLLTAAASVATAVALPPLVPRVLALVKDAKVSRERREQIESANDELNRLNARLKQVDDLKTQFFANVSHELRTPLTLILGPAEKLRTAADLTPDQLHAVDTIERNGRMLLNHVNELLDISKLEAGKMELNPASVDLARVVRLVAANFESIADEREIAFALDVPAALPAKVDEEKLQRVLLNLLSNAFKFTPQHGRIRCALREEVGRAVMEVSDSGPGVPPAMREAVFERYRQLHGEPDQRAGGTGLGLTIVKEFVELHGGLVSVAQSPIGGALFRAEIPLVAADRALTSLQTDAEPRPDAAVQGALAGLRSVPQPVAIERPRAPASAELVLIVEDNPDMRIFLEESLADTYRVAAAANGREGLAKALELKPDLIVSDIMMPEMGGEELLRQVRLHPDLKAVPMIFLSAKTDEAFGVRILREGAQDYLRKPFGMAELRARVKNLIAMHRARKALQTELRSHDEDVSRLTGQLIANGQALQGSERRWRTVFENSPVGIGLTDVTGQVLAANPALQGILGYTQDELRNISLTDLTAEEDRAAARSLTAELLDRARTEYRLEKRYCRKDGSFVWTNTSVSLIPGTGSTPPMLVRIVEDVTERRLAEAALRETEMELAHVMRVTTMGEMVASIAHEINQPLAAVVTNGHACTRWLAADPPDLTEANEAVRRIVRDANRASEVISRIRTFVKRGEAQRAELAVDDLIREVVGLAQGEATTRDIALRVESAANLPCVSADRVQLQQVLLNLIMNGMEAMTAVEQDARTLHIEAKRYLTDKVLVSVKDAGVGLDPARRDQIFEAFYTTKPAGMGMGLAISRSIVEAHGGRLWAVANDGPGETFQFTLPPAAPVAS